MKKLILFLSACLLVAACNKGPQYSDEPFIRFESFSKTTVQQGDSLVISVYFEDGNGDLGFEENSPLSCDLCDLITENSCLNHPTWSAFLIDNRDSCLETFQIPYIESAGKNNSVNGIIDIRKYQLCCKIPGQVACENLGAGVYDTVQYYMLIKDRARNSSNIIALPKLVVECN